MQISTGTCCPPCIHTDQASVRSNKRNLRATGVEEYRDLSESILHSRSNEMIRNPLSSVYLLSALLFRGKQRKIETPEILREQFLSYLGKTFLPEVLLTPGIDNIQVCDDKSCQFTGKEINDALEFISPK